MRTMFNKDCPHCDRNVHGSGDGLGWVNSKPAKPRTNCAHCKGPVRLAQESKEQAGVMPQQWYYDIPEAKV